MKLIDMLFKQLFSALLLLFFSAILTAQSPINILVKMDNSATSHFTINLTVADINYEIDDNGVILNAFKTMKNSSLEENRHVSFWPNGWEGKEGKLKSIEDTNIDYWAKGWGNEREGKIRTIGSVYIEYWGVGWGKEKAGKIKSIGNINLDYWGDGWGKEKEGKVKSIGSMDFDYWGNGWAKKEGKIKSVKGKDENVEVFVSYI